MEARNSNDQRIMGRELLEGERVRLRRIREADVPEIAMWNTDMEYARLLRRGFVFPSAEHEMREWVLGSSDDHLPFAIVEKTDDRLVGALALKDIVWHARHASFYIGIGRREDRGRGYASDAIRVMLRYAFMEVNLNRVGLEVSTYNADAIRAYTRLGFQHEGTLRQYVYRDGMYHDMHLMSMLRSEWQAASERR